MHLEDSLDFFVEERFPYFNQWIFDKPMFISDSHYKKTQRLNKLMNKMFFHLSSNYTQYEHLMPFSDKVKSILNMCPDKPLSIGTFRTDFVFDENYQTKIIEITSRYPLNGLYFQAIVKHHTDIYESSLKEKINAINPSKELYQYLESLRNNAKKVYIIQGRDQKNSSRWYSEIYNRLGLDVNIVHYSDLSSCIEKMNDSWVICELALDEIETIDASILEKLIALNIINDVRAVFISHDKRFFAVMGDSEFQKNALEPDEIEDFNEFYIPTYIYSEKNQELWEDAKLNKDEWIIKHRALGKSKKIFAGSVTPEEEWKDLWKDDDMENMVLQKWVSQGKIRSSLKGKAYEDYATGTLLFINDQHFGYGEFRTSSFPVINKTDHRKMSSVVVSDELFQLFNKNHICIS